MNTNIIYNENCLDGLRKLEDECIDLTVTSPPYDNLRTYNGYSFDFENIAKELYRVTKSGGVVVWIVGDATVKGSETGTSFRQALFFKEIGFNLHDTMIWLKPGFTDTGSLRVRYGGVFEYMFVFSKGKPKTFNPIKDRKNKNVGVKITGTIRLRDGTFRRMSSKSKELGEYGQRFNVWEVNNVRGNERTGHPAQFPEKLASDHIITWSNPGDTVLDLFMGSGTTAIACIKNDRRYIGYEISADYCNLARYRISNYENSYL